MRKPPNWYEIGLGKVGLLSRNKCEECRISGSRKRGKWQSYVMTSPKLPRNKWHEEWRSKWRDPTWFLRSARPSSTLRSEYMCLLTNWLFDEKYRFPLHLCLLFFQPWRNLCQSDFRPPDWPQLNMMSLSSLTMSHFYGGRKMYSKASTILSD